MKRRDFLVAAVVAPLAPAAVAEPKFEFTEVSLGYTLTDPAEQAVAAKVFGLAPGETTVVIDPPDGFQVTLEAGSYKVAGLDLHRVNPGPNDVEVLCFHPPAALLVIKTATYTLHERSHEGNAYILRLG